MDSERGEHAVFVAVVRAGSFRAAARTLGLPPSTVSARVARLEARVGVRLLERTTRSVRLTDAGADFHRDVAAALEQITAAEASARSHRRSPSGRLRVTTTVEFGQAAIFRTALAAYVEHYPDVELELALLDRRVDLVAEGFDVAIRVGRLEDSSLIARKLGSQGALRTYASPKYLAEHGTPNTPQDLRVHACLCMSSHGRSRTWRYRNRSRRVAIDVVARVTANHFGVLRSLAIAGLGVTRLPQFLADAALADGTLVPILDAFADAPAPWHAVYPSGRHLPLRVRAFLDTLAAHLDSASA